MKAREHTKILRESLASMRQRNQEELARMKRFYDGEVADRERIMDNYAKALDRYDVEMAALMGMLKEMGASENDIEFRLNDAIKAWIYGDDEAQP